MPSRRIRRLLLWAAVLTVVAALLPPFINANRFRNKLADTIMRSIGRPVQMGDVHFRLLPQPGFVINNLAITDDPAFSNEPVLRAESVTASLRLISLWRGRLEISKLSLDTPSLNLVESADGHWNVESILVRAAQVPAAPTANPKPENRPRFPYIEADNGRINFRVGQEKRPHVLMDADFSFWLESEGQWNMRLEATPTRTDQHLTDTGLIQAQGWFRRGATLATTQMQLNVNAEKAQLGQWTSLLSGRDRGWRGDAQLQAQLEGTVSDFTINARMAVRDFHRHDIANGDSLDAKVDCAGRIILSAPAPKATLGCKAPVSTGSIMIAGDVSPRRDPDYDLNVTFNDVPMSSFVSLYRRVKRDVPEDLTAQGTFKGDYHLTKTAGLPVSGTGTGKVTGLTVESDARAKTLAFGNFDVQFMGATLSRLKKPTPPLPAELVVGSTGLRLGGTVPVYLTARVSTSQIKVEAIGDADLNELVVASSMFGLADPRYKLTGFANFNLGLQGVFAGFAPPIITGNVVLRQTRTQVDGVAAPILIQSASLQLSSDVVQVQKLSARLEGTNTIAEGTIQIPRGCEGSACISTFDLKAAELSLEELNRVLNPRYRSTDWLALPLRIFQGKPVRTSRLMTLRAQGKIAIGRLVVKNLVATRAMADLAFDHGRIALTNLQADLLSGKHTGEWHADLTGGEPEFRGHGTIDNLPLAQINGLLRSPLGTGTVHLVYDLSLFGADADSLRRSATGTGEFRWSNGSWRTAAGSVLLQFTNWTGRLNLVGSAVQVDGSVMQTRTGPYKVSGKVGLDRALSLRLDGQRSQLLLTGNVQSVSATQETAALPARDPASNLKSDAASAKKLRN